MAVVNSFILFSEQQAQLPDEPAFKRPADYTLTHFREEIIGQICGFLSTTIHRSIPLQSQLVLHLTMGHI